MFAALLLVPVLATGDAWALSPQPSTVADRLARGLAGDVTISLQDVFASDASIVLVGATSALTPAEFQAYVDQLRQQHVALVPSSAVLRTEGGAGWLVAYDQVDPGAPAPRLANANPTSNLWLQATVLNGVVTRLWFHFTAEEVAGRTSDVTAYAANAQSHGIPVPPGWTDGTAAMLRAIKDADQAEQASSRSDLSQFAAIASWLPLLVFVGVMLLDSRARSRREAGSVGSKRLLAGLRRFQATRGTVQTN